MRYVIAEVDRQPKLPGITSPKLSTAQVVSKQEYDEPIGAVEEAAYIVGRLLGVPVAPGFRDGLAWHSIFVDGMVMWHDYMTAEVPGYDMGVSRYAERMNMWADAIRVFPDWLRARCQVFDYIIGNTDRHQWNFGIVDRELVLYDHHGAFDYYYCDMTTGEPWFASDTGLLREHARARDILMLPTLKSVFAELGQGTAEAVYERLTVEPDIC